MKRLEHKLLVDQTDAKLAIFKPLDDFVIPSSGWVHTIRTTLRMSLRQLGNRLKIKPQSVKEIEMRESNGSITINSLRDTAAALEMKLVYGFIPKEESVEVMIEKRANEIARDIVMRTSNTMKLEEQKNSDERIEKAVKNRTEELISKMPTYLWD